MPILSLSSIPSIAPSLWLLCTLSHLTSPAYYALFCVILVGAMASSVWMVLIHLSKHFAQADFFFPPSRHIFCVFPFRNQCFTCAPVLTYLPPPVLAKSWTKTSFRLGKTWHSKSGKMSTPFECEYSKWIKMILFYIAIFFNFRHH